MKYRCLVLSAVLALAALQAQARASILGSAEDFAVLGNTTVTNTGPTTLTGNLGVSPGTAITGFPPGTVSGTIHANDAVAIAAQSALTIAYNGLAAMPVTHNYSGTNLGSLTLTSGVYHFDSSAQLTGTLTLNAQGSNNAYWVFQIETTLTTTGGSSVVFTNLGTNLGMNYGLYWQVGDSATLGAGTTFEGNILALTSIALGAGATIPNGRALAQTGAVTLDTNVINIVGPNGGPGYSGGLTYDTSGKVVPVSGPVPVDPLDNVLIVIQVEAKVQILGLSSNVNRSHPRYEDGECSSLDTQLSVRLISGRAIRVEGNDGLPRYNSKQGQQGTLFQCLHTCNAVLVCSIFVRNRHVYLTLHGPFRP